ncbi:hypothetical protein LP419_39350 [Massilia sp. H-1]|nr:hypothetical protein LP419_39350 [Massilia sp. H-1]
MLDLEGRSRSQTQIVYKIAPSFYSASIADVELFENNNSVATLYGSSKAGDGVALVSRGQSFDSTKTYEAQLVLNRGSKVEIQSDKVALPTRQTLIKFIQGTKATLEVDVINKQVCDVAGAASFGFLQDVRASMKLQPLDAQGNPNGSPREVFTDRVFAPGTYKEQIKVGEVGSGHFSMIISATSLRDPAQSETRDAPVVSHFGMLDQLPVGNVIVDGIAVRDGSMMAQTQSIDVDGRGPDMRFQPSYSTSGNGNIGTMGANWTHNFNSSIRINSCGHVTVSGGDGGGVRFFPGPNNTLVLRRSATTRPSCRTATTRPSISTARTVTATTTSSPMSACIGSSIRSRTRTAMRSSSCTTRMRTRIRC